MTQRPLSRAHLTSSQSCGQIESSPIVVRRVQAPELAAVSALLCRSFYSKNGYWAWTLPLLQLGIHQDLRNRYASHPNQYACIVGLQSQTDKNCPSVVGTVEITLRSLSPWLLTPPVPYVSNLAVDPNARRQGVGRQLLAACDQTVRAWRQDALYLHVLSSNVSAQQLYEKASYRIVTTCSPEWLTYLGLPRRLLLKKDL